MEKPTIRIYKSGDTYWYRIIKPYDSEVSYTEFNVWVQLVFSYGFNQYLGKVKT